MKLKEYIEKLNELLEEKPEVAELDVVYSSDREGNWFSEVEFPPTVGLYDSGEFTEEDDIGLLGNAEETPPNAVCIN